MYEKAGLVWRRGFRFQIKMSSTSSYLIPYTTKGSSVSLPSFLTTSQIVRPTLRRSELILRKTIRPSDEVPPLFWKTVRPSDVGKQFLGKPLM